LAVPKTLSDQAKEAAAELQAEVLAVPGKLQESAAASVEAAKRGVEEQVEALTEQVTAAPSKVKEAAATAAKEAQDTVLSTVDEIKEEVVAAPAGVVGGVREWITKRVQVAQDEAEKTRRNKQAAEELVQLQRELAELRAKRPQGKNLKQVQKELKTPPPPPPPPRRSPWRR